MFKLPTSQFYFCFLCLSILGACGKSDLQHAENSLIGSWEVISIQTSTGERLENGISFESNETEEGELGTFTFTDDLVSYSFDRLEQNYANELNWVLIREKVNQGFSNVEQFTLEMDSLSYICKFGDETSDAEKNANFVRLIYETKSIGPYVAYTLNMEKK